MSDPFDSDFVPARGRNNSPSSTSSSDSITTGSVNMNRRGGGGGTPRGNGYGYRARGGRGRAGGSGTSPVGFHPAFQYDYDDGGRYGNTFRNYSGRGQGSGRSGRLGGNLHVNINAGVHRDNYQRGHGVHNTRVLGNDIGSDINGDASIGDATNTAGNVTERINNGSGNDNYGGDRGSTARNRGGIHQADQSNPGYEPVLQEIDNSGGDLNGNGNNNADGRSRHQGASNRYHSHQVGNYHDDIPFTPPNPNERPRHPHVRAVYGGRDSHPATLNDIPARDWTPPPGFADTAGIILPQDRRRAVAESRLSSPHEEEESPTRPARVPTGGVLGMDSPSHARHRNNGNNHYYNEGHLQTNSDATWQPVALAPPPLWRLTEGALQNHEHSQGRRNARRPQTIDERRVSYTEDGISNPPPPYEAPAPESPAPTYRSRFTNTTIAPSRPQYGRVPSNSSTFDALLPEMAVGTSVMTSGDLFIDGNGLPTPWGRTPVNQAEVLGSNSQHVRTGASPAIVGNSNQEAYDPFHNNPNIASSRRRFGSHNTVAGEYIVSNSPFVRSIPGASLPQESIEINTSQSPRPTDSLNVSDRAQTIPRESSIQPSAVSDINSSRQTPQNQRLRGSFYHSASATQTGSTSIEAMGIPNLYGFIDDQDLSDNPWADNLRLATPAQMLRRNSNYTPRWMRGWDADTYPTELGSEWSSAHAWATDDNFQHEASFLDPNNNLERVPTLETEGSDPTTPRAAPANILVIVTPPPCEPREEFRDSTPRATGVRAIQHSNVVFEATPVRTGHGQTVTEGYTNQHSRGGVNEAQEAPPNQVEGAETASNNDSDSGSETTPTPSVRIVDLQEADRPATASEPTVPATVPSTNIITSLRQGGRPKVEAFEEGDVVNANTTGNQAIIEDDGASEYEDVSDDDPERVTILRATATSSTGLKNTLRPVTLNPDFQRQVQAGPSRHTMAIPLAEENQRLKRKSLSVPETPLRRASRLHATSPHKSGANRRSIIGNQHRVGGVGNRISVIGSPQKLALAGATAGATTSPEHKSSKKYSIGGKVRGFFAKFTHAGGTSNNAAVERPMNMNSQLNRETIPVSMNTTYPANNEPGPSITKKRSMADTFGGFRIFPKKKPQKAPIVISAPICTPNKGPDAAAEAVRRAMFEGAGIQLADVGGLASQRYFGQVEGRVLGQGAVVVHSPTNVNTTNYEQKSRNQVSMGQENEHIDSESGPSTVQSSIGIPEAGESSKTKPSEKEPSLDGDPGPSSPRAGEILRGMNFSNSEPLDERHSDQTSEEVRDSVRGDPRTREFESVDIVEDEFPCERFLGTRIWSEGSQSSQNGELEDAIPSSRIFVTTEVTMVAREHNSAIEACVTKEAAASNNECGTQDTATMNLQPRLSRESDNITIGVGGPRLGSQYNDTNDPWGFERAYERIHGPSSSQANRAAYNPQTASPEPHRETPQLRHRFFQSVNGSSRSVGLRTSSNTVNSQASPPSLGASRRGFQSPGESANILEASPTGRSSVRSPGSIFTRMLTLGREESDNDTRLLKQRPQDKPRKDIQTQGRSVSLLRKATPRALREARSRRKAARELQEADFFQAMGSPLGGKNSGKLMHETPDSKALGQVRESESVLGPQRASVSDKERDVSSTPFSHTDHLSLPDPNTPTMSGKGDNREVTYERLRYLQRMHAARSGGGVIKPRPKSIVRTPGRENSFRLFSSRQVTLENTTNQSKTSSVDVQHESSDEGKNFAAAITPTDVQIPGFLDPFVETYTREALNATITTRPRPNQPPPVANERPAPTFPSRNLPTNQLRPLLLTATLRNQMHYGQPQTPVVPITSQVPDTPFSQAPTLADSRYLMPSPLRTAEAKRAEIRRIQNRYAQMYHPDPAGYHRFHQQQRHERSEVSQLELVDREDTHEPNQSGVRNPPPAFSLPINRDQERANAGLVGCITRGNRPERASELDDKESDSGEDDDE